MTIQELYTIFQTAPDFTTDSRKITPNCLFFALKGERFNGNKFAANALQEGAAYAIIDEKDYKINEQCIVVNNVLQTLQDLARHHRRQFPIPVIGITGSNGKTTTKELVSAVLSSHYPTHFTKGNFNNHIGVPLTLLAMPKNTEVAIIEMGANHVGEIAELCAIAEPTHGLITNIGKAHLEGFGSIEGVKQGKSELYKWLAGHDGLAFVNQDELFLEKLAQDNPLKINYLQNNFPNPQIRAYETQLLSVDPFVKVAFRGDNGQMIAIQSQLIGAYNFNNIMTAIALGRYFKVPAAKIKAAIEAYVPSNNRSQLLKRDRTTIIMDAYNANPISMRSALHNFAQLSATNKVVILGDMFELGKYEAEEHAAILQLAQSLRFEAIITVGKAFGSIQKETTNWHFDTTADAKIWFDQQDWSDKWLLLKGSRGIGLEQLISSK